MYNSKIIGLGKYLPSNVVTNSDLEKIMDTSDVWIQERTGIKERRHIKKGSDDSTSSMGVKASKIALERSGIDAKEIDLILFATLSPDYYFPGSGVLVQDELGIPDCPAMDIRMQCSGFVYALATADQFIKTGMYKNILLAEKDMLNILLLNIDLLADIDNASIKIKKNKDKIVLIFKSKSFLQQQVRSMVGSLKYLGEGKWKISDFKKIFFSKKRSLCAPPAPSCGLYLEKVLY